MFPSNAAAAKRLGKRKVREVTGETSEPFAAGRSQVHDILNNAAAAAPLSYLALLTADDNDGDDYECCPISKDFKNQIDQMIMFHSENLRQSVVGMLSLHRAAEERAAKRLRVSEARVQARNAELERLAELYKGEAERLLLRVRYLETEEAESSFEDPDRVGPVRLDCKVCERELATVMVWPCRHVCVCTRCDAATNCCPVCRVVKTTSVEVRIPLD